MNGNRQVSMKIAIPIWHGRVSPVLDTASRLLVVDIEGQLETSRFEIYLEERGLSRRCFRIRDMGVDILICGAISLPFSRMLLASGVNVIPEMSGQAEHVLEAYLEGNLFQTRFLMPGCEKKRYRQGSGYPGPGEPGRKHRRAGRFPKAGMHKHRT